MAKTISLYNEYTPIDIFVTYVKQGVALTGSNTTGPPCSVTMEL